MTWAVGPFWVTPVGADVWNLGGFWLTGQRLWSVGAAVRQLTPRGRSDD